MEQPKKPGGQGISPDIVEAVERLDEQHVFTTKTLGFLIHPTILSSISSSQGTPAGPLKIADIGTGTGIWLLDVAKTLFPSTTQLVGYDVTPSSFPSPEDTLPPNVRFAIQDMHQPFPESELGTFDVVAVRFVSSATSRLEWEATTRNLMALLKPGSGWLQWIDSCNFSLYTSVPGTSRKACQEIYAGLEPFRKSCGDDAITGLMMREGRRPTNREDVWTGLGLVDVHEDVFSSDRLQDGPAPGLDLRKIATRNVIQCFTGCLESLVEAEPPEENAWTRDKIKRLEGEAMDEIEQGVYHTLDQVCMIGRMPKTGDTAT